MSSNIEIDRGFLYSGGRTDTVALLTNAQWRTQSGQHPQPPMSHPAQQLKCNWYNSLEWCPYMALLLQLSGQNTERGRKRLMISI